MATQGIYDTDKYDINEHITGKDDNDEYDSDQYDSDADSMASGSTISGESLADSIGRAVQKSLFDDKDFWPSGSLDGIVTRERVREQLEPGRRRSPMETQETHKAEQESLNRVTDLILTRRKKSFAIMLCANLKNREIREAMNQFHKLGFDDGHLPLIGDATTRIFISSTTKTYRKPWSHFRVEAFCQNQWKFLAPVFDSKQRELALHTNRILPFTWAVQRGAGMFGEVYEVTIHPAHGKNVVRVRYSSVSPSFYRPLLLTCALIMARIPTLQSRCNAPTAKTRTKCGNSKESGARKSKHTKRLPHLVTQTSFDS